MRIPFAYVPAYLGNMTNLKSPEERAALESGPEQEQLYTNLQEVLDVESMPVKTASSGLWDI